MHEDSKKYESYKNVRGHGPRINGRMGKWIDLINSCIYRNWEIVYVFVICLRVYK
jgi:hypothetical protein